MSYTKTSKGDLKVEDDEEREYITKQQFYAGPHHYLYLDQCNKIQARYIWLGSNSVDMRTKTKTVNLKQMGVKKITSPSQLPIWNYDGSSTGQALGEDSEVLLKPVKIVRDPFRLGKNIIVLCDTYEPEKKLKDGRIQPERPTSTNKRARALKIFTNNKVSTEKPWYGIEQEYTLFTADGKRPLGFPVNGYPEPQGPYYCSVGTGKNCGRQVADDHYKACLYAGLEISGTNAEVCPGQWEFQIGPCLGVNSGDELLIARFLLEKICEEHNVVVKFDPKPIKGDWNGTGCHTNYSTKSMRNKGGYKVIVDAIKKLKERHFEHMNVYGDDNKSRLTGLHETHGYETFDYGVADRSASVRIPRDTEKNGYGYFEDRRPASNMDPYDVTSIIAETTILYQSKAKDEKKHVI